jgi:hypothetical protein
MALSSVKEKQNMPLVSPLEPPGRHQKQNDKGYAEYAVIILSIAHFRIQYREQFPNLARSYHLTESHYEYMYDWIVTEAMSRAWQYVNNGSVMMHYRHDVYKAIYDLLGMQLELYLKDQLTRQSIGIARYTEIKTMVAGDTVFVARGILSNN